MAEARRSGRERKPTARVKESSEDLDNQVTPKRIVKENLSTENKIHLILYPLQETPQVTINPQPTTPRSKQNSTLGKRKRSSTPTKQRPPKKQKIPDDEFQLAKDPSDEELSGTSDDGELSSDDEVKLTKNKNKRLTKRQKAMNTKVVVTDGLLSLPMDTEKRPMTEEEQNKKSEQARRRKRLEERRSEEEKVFK